MFTGLVHGTGKIAAANRRENYLICEIAYAAWSNKLHIGESIAVDGTCLTLVATENDRFTVEISQETLNRTIAGSYAGGAIVNLEQAMQLSDRLMGHLVSGHIDTTGEIARREMIGESLVLEIGFDRSFAALVIEKGSIAINGVSLTVNEITENSVSVNLIPHTLAMTNLTALSVGAAVNVEFDLIGKYVARMIETGHLPDRIGSGMHESIWKV